MLKESKADIFVDPVLHTACALDIKHHCAAITPGRGRRKSLFTLTLPELSLGLPWESAHSCSILQPQLSHRQHPLGAWLLLRRGFCGSMNLRIILQV